MYLELTNDEYHSRGEISNSNLSALSNDPLALHWARDCPQDSTKMKTLDFGSAVHTALLEPHLWSREYAVAPFFNMRTKAGKEEAADFEQLHDDKTIHLKKKRRSTLWSVASWPTLPVARP